MVSSSTAAATATANTSTDPNNNTNNTSNKGRQIPIVCPGHTRPLAELQFCHVAAEQEDRTLLVSACHGMFDA